MSARPTWTGRRALVTGATGLIGSWLCRALVERGTQVVALVRDWDPQSELVRGGTIQAVTVVTGQLESLATLERAVTEHEVDTVFHLGAQTIVPTAHRDPLATFEANIRGTYNLLEACRRHGDLVRRVVVASSDKAYGEVGTLPYTEDMPIGGRHPYEVSKLCADWLAQGYHHTYAVPVAISRCGNVYGGGDLNWSRIVPGTIRSLHQGQRPVVRSDGTYLRDYIHVDDVVEAYLHLAEGLDRPEVPGQVFNFGTGRPVKVLEVVDRLRAAMGREHLEPIVLATAVGEIRDQWLSARKALEVLGWGPRLSLDEGLGRTIRWYDDYLRRPGP